MNNLERENTIVVEFFNSGTMVVEEVEVV